MQTKDSIELNAASGGVNVTPVEQRAGGWGDGGRFSLGNMYGCGNRLQRMQHYK